MTLTVETRTAKAKFSQIRPTLTFIFDFKIAYGSVKEQNQL